MKSTIWFYDRDFYKLFIQERDIKDEILTWEGCSLQCRYYNIDGGNAWDILFPVKYYKRIEKLLDQNKNRQK